MIAVLSRCAGPWLRRSHPTDIYSVINETAV